MVVGDSSGFVGRPESLLMGEFRSCHNLGQIDESKTTRQQSWIPHCYTGNGTMRVGYRTAAAGMQRNANTLIFGSHATINGMHRCLIRANSY